MYPEEQVLGNHFIVNVAITLKTSTVETLDDSIDYAQVLQIIQQRFLQPTLLLETLLQDIETLLYQRFQQYMQHITLSIAKQHPPLPAAVTSSEVVLEKDYS